MKFTIFRRLFLSLLLIANYNLSAQKPQIGPMPCWVTTRQVNFSATPSKEAGGFYYLLIDQQDNVVKSEFYTHRAYQILNADGVQQMADLNIEFDPSYQKLILHSVRIHRSGQAIDQLSLQNIKTIQREQSMDRYLYDGSLTTIINLKDVRVNDIVEYSFTIIGANPVYGGHYATRIYFDFGIPYEEMFQRVLVSASKSYYIHEQNGPSPYNKNQLGQNIEYVWHVKEHPALITDNNTPIWYDPYRFILLTDFANWGELTNWAIGHYQVSDQSKEKLKSKLAELKEGHPAFKTDNKEEQTKAVRHVSAAHVEQQMKWDF